MRILHVPHAYHPVIGGTETICKRVSEVLAAQGHEVNVVTTNVGGVHGYYQYGVAGIEPATEIINGVKIRRLPFNGTLYKFGGWACNRLKPKSVGDRVGSYSMVALNWRLADLLSREIVHLAPDVVMTMPHLVTNVRAVLRVRRRIHFPLVMVPMLHEHDPSWDRNAMADALSHADAVVALTAYELERLKVSYSVSSERLFLSSVGVELEDLPVRPYAERPQKVLYLGRMASSKGLDNLIKSMAWVWAEIPDTELWLVGPQGSGASEIKLQIANLPEKWRTKIKETGFVQGEDRSTLIGSARCLVLPSRIESFGMVLLDAWMQATPVVAWNLPVFSSTVEDGRTGFLADASAGPPSLGEAILRLLRCPKLAERMGAAGRVQAETYSWSSVAATYLQAYDFARKQRVRCSIGETA